MLVVELRPVSCERNNFSFSTTEKDLLGFVKLILNVLWMILNVYWMILNATWLILSSQNFVKDSQRYWLILNILKVHEIENFFTPILEFALFLC
jgi:hypothetical protein